MDKQTSKKLTKKQAEKFKERFALQSLELAGMTQALIKRRIERALLCEDELDKFITELLYHAQRCEDKGKSKAVISRLELLKIEDITKLASLMKSLYDKDLSGEKSNTGGAPEQIKLKFEDIYE